MNQNQRRLMGIAIAAGIFAGCLLLRNEQQARERCLVAQAQVSTEWRVPAELHSPLDEPGSPSMRIVCPGGAITPNALKAAAALAMAFGLLVYSVILFARVACRLYDSAINIGRRSVRARAQKTRKESK